MISNESEIKCGANKKEVYDLLTKNIDFSCIKTVCLFALGSPYYFNRLHKEHPNIEISIIEDKELEFLFYDYENTIFYDLNKELWPRDMKEKKFDCIIMNPPYNKSLHLKILNEAISHAEKIVNLSPVRWLFDPLANYKKGSNFVKYRTIRRYIQEVSIIDTVLAQTLFFSGQYTDLGLYFIDTHKANDRYNCVADAPFKELFSKVIEPLAKNLTTSIKEKIVDAKITPNKHSIFVNLPKVHGHPGNSDFFDITTKDTSFVRERKPSAFYINFVNESEARNFNLSLYSVFYRAITYTYKRDQNLGYKLYPWMGDSINPITGKKGYESEWTDEAFYKFFNISEEEQSIIEKTLEKYR